MAKKKKKKKKSGGRKQPVGGVPLKDFLRAHWPAHLGESESDEDLFSTAFGNIQDRMTDVGQSASGAENRRHDFMDGLHEIVDRNVTWNLENPSALRDGKAIAPARFRRILKNEAKSISENGADDGDAKTIYRLDGLHETINELIPNAAWERATDKMMQNELEGKKGKHRWDGVTAEDKGCIFPFLLTNYMLHAYCRALHDKLRDVGELPIDRLFQEAQQRGGDLYIVTLVMESASGLPMRLTTTQYAQCAEDVNARAEVQAARLQQDEEYANIKVEQIALLSECCEVTQDGDTWTAEEPSHQAIGEGSTREEAIQQLKVQVFERLTALSRKNQEGEDSKESN